MITSSSFFQFRRLKQDRQILWSRDPGASERGEGRGNMYPRKNDRGDNAYICPPSSNDVYTQQSQLYRQMGATLQPNTIQLCLKVSLIRLIEFYVKR